jgi:hypothetical protein
MANEISFAYVSGKTLYAVIRNGTGGYWNGTAFEVFAAANWTAYRVGLIESGGGQYFGTFPAVGAGRYSIDIYDQVGGAAATSDVPPVGGGSIEWTGTAEVNPAFTNLNLGQAGLTVRPLDAVADAALTVGDALVCAISAAAGKEAVVGTAYTVQTPATGTIIRNFVLDSATAPTSRT